LDRNRILLLAINIVVVTAAQMCLKHGMTSSGAETAGIVGRVQSLVMAIFTKPYVLAGYLLFFVSSLMWLHIVKTIPLTVAYPTMMMSLVMITFLSWLLWKDPVNRTTILGLFFICCGVTLVGYGFAQKGSP